MTEGLLSCRRLITFDSTCQGDAIWWEHGAIRMVGDGLELERRVPSRVPRYHLPTALVTPGLVDGHTHFGMWAMQRARVDLAGARTLSEALRRVRLGQADQGWVRGHGWDANHWADPPDRRALDAATEVPAFLESIDVHAAWVNTAGLAVAGVTRQTPDPPGGRIVRDPAGEPTGILLERAQELVRPHLPRPRPDELRARMREAQAAAHRFGITGLHDVEGPEVLRGFRAMELADELRLRVLFHPPVERLSTLIRHRAMSGQGTPWLMLGGVKLFLDGTLGSRTAWMLAPYEDGGDSGLPLTSEAVAREAVTRAAEAGLAVAVHAIGDAAVRRALDLLAPLPRTALPHRIEHLQCIDPADLTRAAQSGIVASMQPAHLPGDAPLAEARWGSRSRGAYLFKSLLRAGTVLALGSDVPVTTPDPRVGIAAAMDRVPVERATPWFPEERLRFDEALRGYTLGNALAGGVAGRRGRLVAGADADLVAWDVDPAVEDGVGRAMLEARVLLTVVGGEVVFGPLS